MSGELVSLALKDFQIHDRAFFKFAPGVNIVVGPNGAGKSTLFRAIRWIVFNRPMGGRFVRWGKDACKAELTTETCRVTRFKGHDNTYQINGGEPFRAVGTDVPKDVTQALRLDEINFQRQIDGPFWLTLSAPEIAREMNRVVDLSVIDRSMMSASSNLRDAQAQVKALTGLLSDARIKVGRLRWVEEVEAEARNALSCEQEAARKRSEAEVISGLVEEIEEAQAASCAIPDPSEAEPLIRRLEAIDVEVSSLNRLISQLERQEEEACVLRHEIEIAVRKAEAAKPETCPECGQVLPLP